MSSFSFFWGGGIFWAPFHHALSRSIEAATDALNRRVWHITGCKLVAILGYVVPLVSQQHRRAETDRENRFALAPALPISNTAGKYVAMCIFCLGTYGVNSIILGWAATVCSQTIEKKVSLHADIHD